MRDRDRGVDILIGQRGGDWYGFALNAKGTSAIKAHAIQVSYGSNLDALKLACNAAGLTWVMEKEEDQTDLKLVDALGALIKQQVGQRRRYSALETVANTISGFTLSFLVNLYLFPVLGIYMEGGPAAVVTLILTGVSIARGYFWRRFFNWLHTRGIN